jgi:2-iminoacetate synthase
MEFSVPGFIKKFCTPNAMLTLAEYLEDYATKDQATKGWAIIHKNLNGGIAPQLKNELVRRLERVKDGERDLYF